jgi:hypothetical protein
MSVITYQSIADMMSEPFIIERDDFAEQMYDDGKCDGYPNIGNSGQNPTVRWWIDHAAAQEFINWVVATAPTYNIVIVSTAIEDL